MDNPKHLMVLLISALTIPTMLRGEDNQSPTVRIDLNKKCQRIDGFGFSTAWGSSVPHDQMDAFFSRKNGAGLSIIRTRVPFRFSKKHKDCIVIRKSGEKGGFDSKTVNHGKPNEYKTFKLNWNHWDLQRTKTLITAIKANSDYELPTFFSTPWTPPNDNVMQWKSGLKYPSEAPHIGGTLKPKHYADYADLLADFVLGFEKNMGAPLHALSIQNEPSYKCKYESCDWTAGQFHDFLKVVGDRWDRKKVFKSLPKLTLIAPEHNNFRESLILPSLKDPKTAALVGIAGGHLYEYGWSKPDPLKINFKPMMQSITEGKRIWMTEWSPGKFGDRNTIGPNLAMAKAMHYLFNEAKLNAFVYWWTKGLLKDDKPNKALWTLAQFSRFVRPGWHHVTATKEPVKGVLISAFANPKSNEIAIVCTNMNKELQSLELVLDRGMFSTITPYRTSAKENMVKQPSTKTRLGKHVVMAPAESITTWYATVSMPRHSKEIKK